MRCIAAASSTLRPVLAGPERPAEWLGVTPAGLYLRMEHLLTAGQPAVLAVLTADAVRLPCGLLLPTTSAELPLTSLAPSLLALALGRCLVGDGAVSWTGPRGPVVVRAVREWAPVRPARGAVVATALAALRAGLEDSTAEIDSRPLADAIAAGGRHEAEVAVAWLLGRGPGLTPSGDDLLAGFLVGASVFGLATPEIAAATAVLAPVRTTALSAALLWHAARGECIDQLAAVAAALCSQPLCSQPRGHGGRQISTALRDLLGVGHTSGAALATGLALAARAALPGEVAA